MVPYSDSPLSRSNSIFLTYDSTLRRYRTAPIIIGMAEVLRLSSKAPFFGSRMPLAHCSICASIIAWNEYQTYSFNQRKRSLDSVILTD